MRERLWCGWPCRIELDSAEGKNMPKDELWDQTYRARRQIWETHFGPFPEQVQKLMNLFGV